LRLKSLIPATLAAVIPALAVPTVSNHSNRTWHLTFGDTADQVAQLFPKGGRRVAATVRVTDLRTGRSENLLRASPFKPHPRYALKPGAQVLLTARVPGSTHLDEILTLEDHAGRKDVVSLFLMGRRSVAVGPSLVVRMNEHLDQAVTFLATGVTVKGDGEVRVFADSYAGLGEFKAPEAELSPILEEPAGTTPAGPAEGKAGPAPALTLPPAAPREERKAPARRRDP